MKHFILCLLLTLFAAGAWGQDYKEIAKERKEIVKASRSELNARPGKTARKAAKAYAKEGWKVAPGQLPLEKQLEKTYLMQYEYDDNYMPEYIMSEAMSIGENYDAAKMQALEIAKLNLAGQIQSNFAAIIENSISNRQLSDEDAASITESVLASKSVISQRLGRVLTVVECYRDTDKGTKEVRIQIAYSSESANSIAKAAIREDLEAKGKELSEELDTILGF